MLIGDLRFLGPSSRSPTSNPATMPGSASRCREVHRRRRGARVSC